MSTALKTQVTSIRKELESVKSKYSEASEKLLEKSRQYQKLQGVYEALRRQVQVRAEHEWPGWETSCVTYFIPVRD